MQDNELTCTESLASLTPLRSLHLDGNRIAHVAGLSQLTNLRRLSLDRQILPDPSTGPTFEHATLAALGPHLTNLSLTGNQLSSLAPLAPLTALETLGIDATRRAETLSVDEFVALARALDQKMKL